MGSRREALCQATTIAGSQANYSRNTCSTSLGGMVKWLCGPLAMPSRTNSRAELYVASSACLFLRSRADREDGMPEASESEKSLSGGVFFVQCMLQGAIALAMLNL